MEKNGLFSQRIRLRHLHTFVAVAQQGTLGRAAETLNLSQPALSKTLNELEQLTGTRLFERGRLGAQLTLVGEQFLTHAVKVLDALNSAGQALNRKEGLNNDIVRIGALPTAALGILPTVIGVAESSIRAVPDSYYEGALALGATRERSVFFAVLPGAKSGILAGVVLGIGRAIGETMAVIMVAGNQPIIPKSLGMGVRTLTSNIVMEMGYATDLHREALIATAVVLFVLILIINLCCSALQRGNRQ